MHLQPGRSGRRQHEPQTKFCQSRYDLLLDLLDLNLGFAAPHDLPTVAEKRHSSRSILHLIKSSSGRIAFARTSIARAMILVPTKDAANRDRRITQYGSEACASHSQHYRSPLKPPRKRKAEPPHLSELSPFRVTCNDNTPPSNGPQIIDCAGLPRETYKTPAM